MGSLGFDLSLCKALQEARMSSYSSSYTVTTTTTSSDSRNMRAASAGSDLDDLYFKSFCMTDGDRFRMGREFFSPAPISLTGNYWARPYFNYKTPSTYASKYGHSKYINIRKL